MHIQGLSKAVLLQETLFLSHVQVQPIRSTKNLTCSDNRKSVTIWLISVAKCFVDIIFNDWQRKCVCHCQIVVTACFSHLPTAKP